MKSKRHNKESKESRQASEQTSKSEKENGRERKSARYPSIQKWISLATTSTAVVAVFFSWCSLSVFFVIMIPSAANWEWKKERENARCKQYKHFYSSFILLNFVSFFFFFVVVIVDDVDVVFAFSLLFFAFIYFYRFVMLI